MRATIIIPFHRNLDHLRRSLDAARQSMPTSEILVAADGSPDDCRPLAKTYGAVVLDVPGPSGPAVARNRAAAVATGDILLFVDSDVVVSADALPGMCDLLGREPGLAGVFGAYDHSPGETNFMSQYRNLAHAYVHERGNPNAATFWAGLGAMRTDVFRSVGGFDERFGRPSVEDIDLGYRVVAAGHTLRLDPTFRGTHLKRWTIANSVAIDIRARGVPWTQLIHRFQALSNDLNTSFALRLSVVLAYGILGSLVAAVATANAWFVTAALLAVLVGVNFDYYRWFAKERGVLFAVGVIPAHLLHHLCNGVSFVVGTALYLATRIGWRLPGSLPSTAWAPHARPFAGSQFSRS